MRREASAGVVASMNEISQQQCAAGAAGAAGSWCGRKCEVQLNQRFASAGASLEVLKALRLRYLPTLPVANPAGPKPPEREGPSTKVPVII
jgi:hypothetical protein